MTKGVKILILLLSSLTLVGVGVLVFLLVAKSKYAFMDQTGLSSPAGGKTLIKSKKALTVGVYTVNPGNRMVVGKESRAASLLWQLINGGKYTEVTITQDDNGCDIIVEGSSSDSKNGTLTNNSGGTVVFTIGVELQKEAKTPATVSLRKNKVFEFSETTVVELGGITYSLDPAKAYQILYTEEAGYVIEDL